MKYVLQGFFEADNNGGLITDVEIYNIPVILDREHFEDELSKFLTEYGKNQDKILREKLDNLITN